MTAQGNALGWRTLKIIIALKGRNMEVMSEKRIEKKIISLFTTIVLALTGRLFAWRTPLPRALPWAVMLRPYRPEFKRCPFYKFQQYNFCFTRR
jgi:hypothetical protein